MDVGRITHCYEATKKYRIFSIRIQSQSFSKKITVSIIVIETVTLILTKLFVAFLDNL